MHKPLLLLAATALIAATPAADLDKNGEVTRAEFMAASEARFAAADTNFDGQLTVEERRILQENQQIDAAKRHHARMDANGDGSVSEAEMLAAREEMKARRDDRKDERQAHMEERRGETKSDRSAEMKARIDTDGDGTISAEERAAAKTAMKARRAEQKAQRKEQRAERPRLDADRDGIVTRAEYDAMSEALFARMDVDGNGVLTQGEGRKRRKGPKPPKGE